MKRVVAALLLAAAVTAATLIATAPVRAASQGSGFGTWAPISAYGWHGSMLIDGVHTYCIRPGLPAPTGPSADHGVTATAAGLSPSQLTGINLLVSKYGQTDDPVQAAGVGWAVKAIADWGTTLHAFGYPGDTLQGAINWTFSALAPESNEAVQRLATAYYAEATAAGTGPVGGSGSLVLTIDPEDPVRGTVTAVTEVADVRGTLSLEQAVFADTGSPTREGVAPGEVIGITAVSPDAGGAFRVHGAGTFRGGYQAAVRHYTTDGGQDTAGPAGTTEFSVAGEDAADRWTTFAPVITTQVASRYTAGTPFVDDVTFSSARGAWPRAEDGSYARIAATATIYRTPGEPVLSDAVPDDAEAVAALAVSTHPDAGPEVAYRVESEEPLPGPGFYTAVWRIHAADQAPDVQRLLDAGYDWVEAFGERSQVTIVPAVSSRADPVVAVPAAMSDDIIVEGPVPSTGLDLSVSLYRAPEGVAPSDACTPDRLVWSSADTPVRVTAPGVTRITAPRIAEFGTYYWRERAVDVDGMLVHEGACGTPSETTRAPLPTVATVASERAAVGEPFSDTASVAGLGADADAELVFFVYRNSLGDAPDCSPARLLAETAPVPVRGSGEYPSPQVRSDATGVMQWVAELRYRPTSDAAAVVLVRGACGQERESTVIGALATTGTPAGAPPVPVVAMVGGGLALLGAAIAAARRPRSRRAPR